jgi:hypothetical protein
VRSPLRYCLLYPKELGERPEMRMGQWLGKQRARIVKGCDANGRCLTTKFLS